MSWSGATRAWGTCLSALLGISGNKALSGSCTIATPPPALTTISPAVPSSSMPVRMTPTTCGPYAAAAERKSGTMAGAGSRVVPALLVNSLPPPPCENPGGATYTLPHSMSSPFLG
jgi:hypothetical protein